MEFLPPSNFKAILDSIANLVERPTNWNGFDVLKPNTGAIDRARSWILSLMEDIFKLELVWQAPHISSDETGNIVFEWWNSSRKLVAYIHPASEEFLKISGPDIDTEMVEVSAGTRAEKLDAWVWLAGGI